MRSDLGHGHRLGDENDNPYLVARRAVSSSGVGIRRMLARALDLTLS
jgi:hypothetical protein